LAARQIEDAKAELVVVREHDAIAVHVAGHQLALEAEALRSAVGQAHRPDHRLRLLALRASALIGRIRGPRPDDARSVPDAAADAEVVHAAFVELAVAVVVAPVAELGRWARVDLDGARVFLTTRVTQARVRGGMRRRIARFRRAVRRVVPT